MSASPREDAAAAATTVAGAAVQDEAAGPAGATGGHPTPHPLPPLPNGGAGGAGGGGATTDGSAPAPYPHQVGGHGAMVSLGGRLLKPLSRKELAFYTRLWDDAATGPALRWLRAATPRFYGVYRPPSAAAARGAAAAGAAAVDAAAAGVAAVGLTPAAPPGGVNEARRVAAAAEAAKAAAGGASPAAAAAAAASAAAAVASTGGAVPPADDDSAAAATAATSVAAAHDGAVSAGVPATPPALRVPLTWDSDVVAMASSAMASSANPDVAPGQLVDDSPAAREAAAAAVAAAREEVELGPAARLRRAVRVATISPWAERTRQQTRRRCRPRGCRACPPTWTRLARW